MVAAEGEELQQEAAGYIHAEAQQGQQLALHCSKMCTLLRRLKCQ